MRIWKLKKSRGKKGWKIWKFRTKNPLITNGLIPLGPQSRFGDKLLGIRVNLGTKRDCGSTRDKPEIVGFPDFFDSWLLSQHTETVLSQFVNFNRPGKIDHVLRSIHVFGGGKQENLERKKMREKQQENQDNFGQNVLRQERPLHLSFPGRTWLHGLACSSSLRQMIIASTTTSTRWLSFLLFPYFCCFLFFSRIFFSFVSRVFRELFDFLTIHVPGTVPPPVFFNCFFQLVAFPVFH